MIRRSLGASRRYLLNLLDNPAVILLYHRVTHLETDLQLLSVTPENFCEQVSFLKKNYTLLQIDEFADMLINKKKIPKNAVVLTFDDGYADNYLQALPILESLNAQALFYITTSNIDTNNELWWDQLERIFSDEISPYILDIKIGEKNFHFSTSDKEERLATYHALHPIIKYATIPERDKALTYLFDWSGSGMPREGRSAYRMMTTDELKKMNASASAVIGAHTVNHPALSTLNYEDQLAEINLSKKFLEKTLNKKIDHFAYPFGSKKDYDKNSIKACVESGFKVVCANYYNQVHKWADTFQVPRILVRDWNKQTFIEHLRKFFRY